MATTIRTSAQAKKDSAKKTKSSKPTTIRTAKQAKQQDRVKEGQPAKAGQTKSILDVLKSTGLSKQKATTIRAGGGGRAARTRGGVNPYSRANTSANSLSH